MWWRKLETTRFVPTFLIFLHQRQGSKSIFELPISQIHIGKQNPMITRFQW